MDLMIEQMGSIPRQRTKKVVVDKSTQKTITRYQNAYQTAYGSVPQCTVEGKWIRVQWKADRVTRKRLREMTSQLEYRNG